MRARFFLRFEDQNMDLLCHIVLFQLSIALRPSRPASRPASKLAPKCFVLIPMVSRRWSSRLALRPASNYTSSFFFCRRPLPFGGSHLRLPSGPAGIRTTTGSLSALARPTPYQLSHRVALPPTILHLLNFLFGCNFHILKASRLALRPGLFAPAAA